MVGPPEKYERPLGWWQKPNISGKMPKVMATIHQPPVIHFIDGCSHIIPKKKIPIFDGLIPNFPYNPQKKYPQISWILRHPQWFSFHPADKLRLTNPTGSLGICTSARPLQGHSSRPPGSQLPPGMLNGQKWLTMVYSGLYSGSRLGLGRRDRAIITLMFIQCIVADHGWS